jgi:hypothetical protein
MSSSFVRRTAQAFAALLIATAPFSNAASADEEIFVWGARTHAVGEARAASEGVVNFAGFEDRPLLRAGELLEVVPGFAATQHSGTGMANQYFLAACGVSGVLNTPTASRTGPVSSLRISGIFPHQSGALRSRSPSGASRSAGTIRALPGTRH